MVRPTVVPKVVRPKLVEVKSGRAKFGAGKSGKAKSGRANSGNVPRPESVFQSWSRPFSVCFTHGGVMVGCCPRLSLG